MRYSGSGCHSCCKPWCAHVVRVCGVVRGPVVHTSSGTQAAALEAWESGGVGAYECYIAADDEELTAAEVYGGDEDEGNQLLSVPPV